MDPDRGQFIHYGHALLDRLPSKQLAPVCGLMESMLSDEDCAHARDCAAQQLSHEESIAVRAGMASLAAYEGVSLDDVLSDFGLDREDLRRLVEAS